MYEDDNESARRVRAGCRGRGLDLYTEMLGRDLHADVDVWPEARMIEVEALLSTIAVDDA